MSDTRPPILIPGNLKGSVPRNIVSKTDYIYDDPWDKTQREINEEFDQRITDIQELAEISIEGGDIQIATAADFIEPISPESRAKIPTVGAIADGYVLPETGNLNTPVFINSLHKPQIITGLDLPEDIHSGKNIEADGGVSARGIASLAMGSGGGTGTITEIQIDEVPQPSVDGVVNLPAYPIWNTLAGKPVFASVATSGSYNDLIDKPSIPQGTVTSIGMTVPLGLSVNPTAITDSGIFAISFTDGYSIPTIDAQNAWDAKYDKDPAGIPITDLSDDVRTSLGKADTALESVTNLKTGLTSKGAHNLPIYLNANSQAVVIDALSVPGDIQSTNGGVSAEGIASLALNGGGCQGTITEIQIDGKIQPETDGVVNLPAYPTWNTLSGKPILATVAISGSYEDLTNKPSIPQGTVTSIGMTVPTGLSVSPAAITTNGTFAIAFDTGYSIPTTEAQTAWTAKYDKPSTGIPLTDLEQAVQSSLEKADTALQEESDPVFTASVAYGITSIDVSAWNAKYDKDPNGIPLSDLTSTVQTSLGKADSAIQGIKVNGGSVIAPDTNKIVNITDVASATSLAALKTGLAGKGAHNLPIYLNADSQAVAIDSLSVPGNIQSTNGGVSANGIASLAISGGGSQGTVTAINFEGSSEIYTPSDGLITLPSYPTAEDLILDGLASQDYVASYFASNFTQSNIKNTLGISDWALASTKPSYNFSEIGSKPTTLAGYGITDAHITNGVVTLGQNTITPATLNNGKIPLSQIPDAILGQMLYGGTVNGSGVVTLSQNAKDKWGITSLTLTSTNYADYEGGFFIASANGSSGVPSSLGVLVGDWIIATSAGWGKIDNTDAVTGVKGNAESNYRIGNVNITPANIGLGNVENTALSTWAGTNNITTLGTITTGVWHGSAIGYDYLANAVQSSLGKADSAIQGIKVNSGSVITPDANKIVNITDVASANALATLKTGLTSKGSHNLPIYLNSSAQAVVIDALSVPGDIQSTGGGVSAEGIASLALNGGGGQGTITQIQIDDVAQPESDGVVNLPAYPTWATLSGKPALATVATTGSYNDLTDKPSIPQGTVTSIGMTVPTGLSVSPSAITTNGTFAITLNSDYSIPTIANQTAWSNKYDKPSGGIPETDLASAVRTSLGKADTALQSESDPVFTASAAHGITSDDITAWNGKQNALAFDGTYDASTNKVATKSTVTNAINALDVSNISGFGAGKTLASLTETDGKIAATFQNISITKSQVSDFPTTWALSNITGADDLKAIEALTGTSGFLKKTAANRWALDTDVASGTALSGVTSRVGDLEGYFDANGVANSAAKLNTAHSLWGQSFDGSANVNGDIAFSSASMITCVDSSSNAVNLFQYTSNNIFRLGYGQATKDALNIYGKAVNIRANGLTDGAADAYIKVANGGTVDIKGILSVLNNASFAGTATVASHITSTNGNIQALNGGVSASGIASLALNGGGSQGTLTQIQVNGVALADTSGVVNITATTGNAAGKIAIAGQQIPVYGLGNLAYLSSLAFTDLSSHPTTLGDYGITDAKIANGVITLGGNTITPLISHQTLYNLVINNSAGTAQITYKPAVSGTYALTLTKAMVGLSNVENTKLSTWTGSANITTLGTITTGTWQGTAIADSYIASAATWNAKQDAISDLSTIRSRADEGHTAYGYFSGTGNTLPNNKLVNSSISIAGTSVSLGGSITAATLKTNLGLGASAYLGYDTTVTKDSAKLITSGAVWTAIDNLPEPMVFKGSLGTGGTITALPVNGSATIGDTYKVITAGTYASKAAKVGDTFICLTKTSSANTWELIPSGDEPSGTVTSVGLSMPTGFSVSSSPVTTSGTLTVAFASGYSLPTTAKQGNWDTAYGWGNHASAGYALASNLGTASTHAHGDYVTGISWDSTNNKLAWSKGGTAQTAITIGYASRGGYSDALRNPDYHSYQSRMTTGNRSYNDGALRYYLITSSMTDTGRPSSDGYGLHFAWDNSAYDTQLYVSNSTNSTTSAGAELLIRHLDNSATWGAWKKIYDEGNLTKSVITTLIGSTTYAPYNANGYLPLNGGTMTGILTLWGSQYNAYDTGAGALNLNNSDITGVNSILTADLSNTWKESIGFKRTNGNYDTFRAADGVFYFGVNNGTEYTALHSGNSSVSKSGETLTVKINGVEQSLTNTNTTYSANNGVGLSGTTFYNSGVRAATINGNYLRINTNGTNADLTIPYATNANFANTTHKINAQISFSVGASGKNKYRKIGTITIANRYNQVIGTLQYYSGLSTGNNDASTGFLYINAYQQNALGQSAMVTFEQLGDTKRFKFYAVEQVSNTSTVIDIYATIDVTYHGISIAQISGTMSLSDGGSWLDELPEGTRTIEPSFTARVGRADRFTTARSINGTSFDGTTDITTANWGTARNISIADSDSTNTGTAVSVNGSAAVTLKLPTTIKATLSGNASSATKATNDSDGNAINTTYLKKSGGTITASNNVLNIASTNENSYIYFKSTVSGSLANRASVGYYSGFAFIANEVAGYARIGVANDGTPQYWSNNQSSTAKTLWHAGNDGSGSGLDADLLDGKHASSFVLYDAGAAEQTIKSSISTFSKGVINLWRNNGDYYTFLGFSNGTTETYLGGIGFKSQADHNFYHKDGENYYKIWDENNDGSGSGLDADKLDGQEGSYYQPKVSALGSTAEPVYISAAGTFSKASKYAGGTAVTLNGTSKAASTASFYAPTGAGTSGQILKSTAGIPEWINQSALVAGKATILETTRTLWGQNFNGSANVTGDMANVGNIAFQASGKNIGGTLYFDTTNHRVGVNDSTPSCAFDVTGDVQASGGVAAGGILNLAYNGAGTQGTLTQIQINGRALTDTSGIVNIPLANTTSTGDGAMSHSDKLKLDGIATGATNVNTDTVAGWGYTKNAGTVTGVKMNGSVKGSSGVVDLGTVITDVSGKADKQMNVLVDNNGSATITMTNSTTARYHFVRYPSSSSVTAITLQQATSALTAANCGTAHYELFKNEKSTAITLTLTKYSNSSYYLIAPSKTITIPANSSVELSYIHIAGVSSTFYTVVTIGDVMINVS